MKVSGIASTAILSLLLAIAAPAFAQQEQRGEKQGHPEAQAGQHEQAKPAAKPAPAHVQQQRQQPQHTQQPKRQEQAKQPQHAPPQKQAEQKQRQQPQHAQQPKRQQQAKQPQHAPPARQQDKNSQSQRAQRGNTPPQRTQAQERVQQSSWQQQRAKSWESDHRTWQQRGGYHGYRIPNARFRGYFGSEHGFRIYGLPFLVVRGHPRFRYRGYWFSPVDPWPESWANNWYDTDDVYITYTDNGYYLFDRVHPESGIAISISL